MPTVKRKMKFFPHGRDALPCVRIPHPDKTAQDPVWELCTGGSQLVATEAPNAMYPRRPRRVASERTTPQHHAPRRRGYIALEASTSTIGKRDFASERSDVKSLHTKEYVAETWPDRAKYTFPRPPSVSPKGRFRVFRGENAPHLLPSCPFIPSPAPLCGFHHGRHGNRLRRTRKEVGERCRPGLQPQFHHITIRNSSSSVII